MMMHESINFKENIIENSRHKSITCFVFPLSQPLSQQNYNENML